VNTHLTLPLGLTALGLVVWALWAQIDGPTVLDTLWTLGRLQ